MPKYNILDQIFNYAKGHYIQGKSSFKDVQRIFEKCEQPNEAENVITELSHIVCLEILKSSDPLKEYEQQTKFLYNAIPNLLKEMYISELDDVDEILEKARAALIEVITQSLLVVLAKSLPDDEREYEKPNPKIMSVRDKVKS